MNGHRRKLCRLYLLLALLVPVPALVLGADEAHPKDEGWYVLPSTFWAIISFLIVLFILWKKLFPLITDAIDRRAREIRDSLAAAEKAKMEAEEAMQRHQADLDAARHEARAIIEEGKADAQRVKDEIVQSARKEAEEVSERARREIQLAKQAALEELHHQSVQLSLDLAGRLIQKSLDPHEHQELIEDRLRSFREGT